MHKRNGSDFDNSFNWVIKKIERFMVKVPKSPHMGSTCRLSSNDDMMSHLEVDEEFTACCVRPYITPLEEAH